MKALDLPSRKQVVAAGTADLSAGFGNTRITGVLRRERPTRRPVVIGSSGHKRKLVKGRAAREMSPRWAAEIGDDAQQVMAQP